VKWVGTFTDIDDHKRLSEELEHRVAQRTLDLQRSLLEKTTLLKEVHHRVKNNLQVICSLLSLQIECSGEDGLSGPLRAAHHRVLAMSLVHEQLYQSATLSDLDFGEYIELLAGQLFNAYCVDPARIRLELSVEPFHLTIDHAVPCGLILNELLANSLKHAFPKNREGLIRITFRKIAPARAELTVADNGIGMHPDFRYEDSPSLGLQVVRTLVSQLRGKLHVSRENGTSFRFDWDPC
jgi:two-component sensor histidine kinase